jgi:uncharacterized membrane protein YidH (DUF202 family)
MGMGKKDKGMDGKAGEAERRRKDSKVDASGMFLGFEERPLTKAERRGLELQEIQVILAEKRTSLSLLRTGITIYALPLSVLSFLVVTSKLYEVQDITFLFASLMALVIFLVVLGTFFVYRALSRIHAHDHRIAELRKEHRFLERVISETEESTILHMRQRDEDDDYED